MGKENDGNRGHDGHPYDNRGHLYDDNPLISGTRTSENENDVWERNDDQNRRNENHVHDNHDRDPENDNDLHAPLSSSIGFPL